ncbi:N-acetyl-gamma-glutamyl-phosphate reductase [Pseudoflavonifractor sp. AF19-9AC]|uniref:N-acetyl-gamma-glutamyl-phosphate reductase n=1 Tax=Pseudoflavonifractor sp. AF19-9AC TaxID=2292244 RepID=UPI000E556311|nr:N-acetyl-gamma-glutamyl-phosphate reductase [Pseudoflavonifractor sp. AF19-9AC]RHR11152.1 N-acetyl-gamma-glutamyl-phosphate reductase [Pseudoflavonifractor sp. AF19-9AC]
MKKPKVYIDGKEGTTGLQIYQRLGEREDIELLLIDEDKRKDPDERKKFLNAADLVFLCLPDAAAVEAVSMIENPATRVIDASTAHRTAEGWVYGFPELLPGQRQRIKFASRVANPGCHATGFLSTAAPLVKLGLLPTDYPLTCFSLTGYSGGGKKMIAEYEAPDRSVLLDAPSIYATGLQHKHLPEMQKLAGLDQPPVFAPILGDIYKGMATSILLQNRLLKGNPSAQDIWELLMSYYEGQSMVTIAPFGGRAPRLAANAMAGRDVLEITVSGHGDQTMLTAQFDNLGKGASGAAVQNMNIMLGFPEITGLTL